jgi:hypothetical protein
MAWALTWNVLRNALTFLLAVFVTAKAAGDFEALAFLMALIAYHRLVWFIDAGMWKRNRGI